MTQEKTLADWLVSIGFEYRSEYLREQLGHDNKLCFVWWVTIKLKGYACGFEEYTKEKQPPRMMNVFESMKKYGNITLDKFLGKVISQEKFKEFWEICSEQGLHNPIVSVE